MSFSSLETPSYLSFRCHSCQQRSSNTACRWWLSWPNVREPVTFRSQECVKGSVFKLALIPPNPHPPHYYYWFFLLLAFILQGKPINLS